MATKDELQEEVDALRAQNADLASRLEASERGAIHLINKSKNLIIQRDQAELRRQSTTDTALAVAQIQPVPKERVQALIEKREVALVEEHKRIIESEAERIASERGEEKS